MTSNDDKIIKGMLIGLVTGFVGGLLLAPKSGKETREHIKSVSANIAKKSETKLKNIQSELNDVIEKAQKYSEDRANKVTMQFSTTLDRVKAMRFKINDLVNAMQNNESSNEELSQLITDSRTAISDLKKYFQQS